MSSAKERTTSAVLRCWSIRLRPTGLRSVSLSGIKTRLYDGRRWRRSSKCWPAMSSTLPVVMVKKKEGSLCFCVDFRQLNAATVKDAHPLPRIDDLFDTLQGAPWFSTLDLKSGYWQFPIMERDNEKTAFRTSSGQLYEFNQVPFGLCNTPATFSLGNVPLLY